MDSSLEREGYYTPTTDDTAHCKAVDKLLVAEAWSGDGSKPLTAWQDIINKEENSQRFDKGFEKFQVRKAQHAPPSEPPSGGSL